MMPVSLTLELCATTIQKYGTAAVADLLIRYTIGKLSNQAQIEYTVSQKACLRT
jgi:hypothetical protein